VLADAWGFNQSVAGAIFTAIATSLPELVTAVAAVRRGALTLAVGGVIGGNGFDTLFAAVADVVYRPGSLYHAAPSGGSREVALVAGAIVMTAVLLVGLLRRERHGPAGIGLESVAVLMIYLGVMAMLGAG
jgi:cation:H+ antiporter